MERQKLSLYAGQLSRRLAVQISIAFTSVMLLFAFLYVWQSRNETISSLASYNSPSLAYWMMVGDSFEISRALQFMSNQPTVRTIALIESGSNGIVASATSNTPVEHYLHLEQKSLHEIKSSTGFEVGHLDVTYSISLVPFLVCIVIGLATFLIMSPILARRADILSKAILNPVISFVDQLGRAKTASELSALNPTGSRFEEVQKLAHVIQSMGVRVDENEQSIRNLTKKEAVYKLTRQVAHDIRSPLSALKILSQSTKSMSADEKNLIDTAAERIEKLATDMLSAGSQPISQTGTMSVQDILRISNETLSLKSVEVQNAVSIQNEIKLEDNDWRLIGNPQDFQRILSNLVNNAIEASPGQGKILISSKRTDNTIVITVRDYGKGIPAEVLANLGTEGFTTKSNGHGFGIWYAKSLLKTWNGQLDIQSEVGTGTLASIHLRRSRPLGPNPHPSLHSPHKF